MMNAIRLMRTLNETNAAYFSPCHYSDKPVCLFPVDVFSIDGGFFGSTGLTAQPLYVSDLFMYAVAYDEEDNLLLQKFQYKIVH